MTEDEIKDLLFFGYKYNIDIPRDLILENNLEKILEYLKERLEDNLYLEIRSKLGLYTHENGQNKIDLSFFPTKKTINENNEEEIEINHINIDYRNFIGIKIPFLYKNTKGILEIIQISIQYTVNPSEKISENWKRLEEEYGNELTIIDKYLCSYKDELAWLTTNDLINVNLTSFKNLNKNKFL